jgi:YVTN family beta-propeller protein
MIDFRILGPLEAVDRDGPMALGGPKQKALLALLLLHRNQLVSTSRLIDELWGERPPPTAIKIVQGYISNLRKVLGDGVLVTRGHGYVLHMQPGAVDVDRFESLAAQGRRALRHSDGAIAAARLQDALALWRGPALADFAYEPFAQGEIARLEDARLAALEDRIEAELMLGDHGVLVGELEALVGEHRHRERLLAQLMLALYRSGRQADALSAYHRARTAVSEELGLEPGPQLRTLQQQILNHDPALDPPIMFTASSTDHARAARGHKLIVLGGALLLAAAISAAVVELTAGAGNGLRAAPNSVAEIDIRTNSVVAQAAVGARPSAIAFGFGSLWVADLDDHTISRVDPHTLRTSQTVPVDDPPTAVAAAGGAIWVVDSNPTADYVAVNRIDPQFGTVQSVARVGNVVPGTPAAAAANGSTLWVAPNDGDLTRLDARTGKVVQHVDPNAAPTQTAVVAGAVCVTDIAAGTVTRVDPSGLVTTPIPVGPDPTGIAVGDGAVWVADAGDDSAVRIDPTTNAVTTTIGVGESPSGVSIGAGSVWVANSGDGTVTRIDPATGAVIATIEVGGSPQAVTIADGHAWVTVDAQSLPPTSVPARGGTLRVDSLEDVDSMDPALADGPLSWELLYATCAKLLNYPDKPGPAGSQLVPEVAQSLPARSADGKTYTFTIRRGFRFSPPSNEPVTAEAFKHAIERTLNPRMKSQVASEFADIDGARAYMAGQATQITGVIAHGNKLTIRLTAPAPDFLSRVTEPAFCAVPTDTPIDPNGEPTIPMAGPYRIASYVPGQGIVLTRNPNYHGDRPHRFARIDVAVDVPGPRAVAEVEAGTADYANFSEIPGADVAALDARYGAASQAAQHGHQQYFVNAAAQLDLLALNTHRPLFASTRLRRAVSYAINRTALARLGDAFVPLPDHPTDDYLTPGVPGYGDLHIYPLTPDLAAARPLARGHAGAVVVLYTCDIAPCGEQAQIIKTDLAAIGLRVDVKTFSLDTLLVKLATPGEPFDIAWEGWIPDYADPDALLNSLLESGTAVPTFVSPTYNKLLAAAAELTGAERYATYARLDAQIDRNAAPLIAFGNLLSHDLFSARVGCQVYNTVYGIDLTTLCVRNGAR